MPLQQNPLDRMAEELAEWADTISTQIADGIKGGFAAPGAARISESQKLAYYTQMMFGTDGQPNIQGRGRLMERMGPEQFAATYEEVIVAHPELKPPEPQPFVAGYRVPTDTPGVSEITQTLPETRPTSVPGVQEVVS